MQAINIVFTKKIQSKITSLLSATAPNFTALTDKMETVNGNLLSAKTKLTTSNTALKNVSSDLEKITSVSPNAVKLISKNLGTGGSITIEGKGLIYCLDCTSSNDNASVTIDGEVYSNNKCNFVCRSDVRPYVASTTAVNTIIYGVSNIRSNYPNITRVLDKPITFGQKIIIKNTNILNLVYVEL